MKKSRPLKKFFTALIILFIIFAVLIGIDFYQKVFTPFAGYDGKAVTINIKPGSAVSAIARQLYRNHIISNYYYFRIYYRLLFNSMSFKTGEYQFDRPTTMKEVIEKLHEGLVVEVNEEVGPVTRKKQSKISYNKRQFYDRILTPMKSMGMIDYDLYKRKYTLSDKFQKVLSNIGVMWLTELKKPIKAD